ncbi:MAG: sialidase family protein [Gemmatimonadota bacterium]
MSLLVACSVAPTESVVPPPARVRIEVMGGNGQVGDPGDSLALPIDIRVTDESGTPLAARRIVWVGANGLPTEDTTQTDPYGRTTVRFVLGDTPGASRLIARPVAATDSVMLDFVTRHDPSADPVIAFDPFLPLDLRTYDGSNETVHPDYVDTPRGSFLVVTPYPQGNRNFENPSFYGGLGSWRWRTPSGLRNPVVQPTGSSYLSDPDLVYNASTSEIWLYYRQVDEGNDIYLVRSTTGVKWSPPVLVVHAPRDQLVSPAVVRRSATEWLMWAVDAGAYGCSATSTKMTVRRSSDGISWGPPTDVTLSAGAPMPWHLDVQWIPSRNEYWGMYSAKPSGSCAPPAMMFARSPDGVAWVVNEAPVVVRGMNEQIADVVYRASFQYDATTDNLRLWISGAAGSGGVYSWHTVYERIRGATLFDGSARLTNPWTFTPSLPLLTEGP